MQEWIKKQRQTIVTGIVVMIWIWVGGMATTRVATTMITYNGNIYSVAKLVFATPSRTRFDSIGVSAGELGQYDLFPLATPPPVPQQNSGDPAFSAWLSFIGVIIGALITVVIGSFGVAIYNNRRNAQIERERIQAQRKLELERNAAQLELEWKRFELDQERMRFQAKMEDEKAKMEDEKAKSDREQQRKEQDEKATNEAMQRAKTTAEREQVYRDALHADPRIARMQILDMSHPMEVTNVFVRVRLHREPRPSYELDPLLRFAPERRNPNDMIQSSYRYLEIRSSSAIDPDEAIRRYKRCVFVGDPGAGKTTLLKYLALRAVEKQLTDIPNIPIHIELNAFATSNKSDLLDFAATTWEGRYNFPKADARAYMDEKLRSGNAILLLDALDETVAGITPEEAEVSYKRAWDAIMKLVTRYHQSPIVVTARKAGYYQHARLTGFTELEVLDFRPEDIEQFVHNWFACSPEPRKGTSAGDLNAKFARNARLQALAANPLLLSLIVIVYEDQLALPEKRAKLYERCVETLLNKWDSSRDIRRRRKFEPEKKRQLLTEIAWHFHCLGQRYYAESELLNDVMAGFLPAIGLSADQHRRVLAEITTENGLLKEQAKHWYGFLHLTLQEYFAALYITDNQQLSTLFSHLGDPWWEEVLLLHAGQTSDATPLFQGLIGSDAQTPLQDDIFFTRLILAGRCLTARPTIRNTALRQKVIDRLFQILSQTPYSLTREQVANTLAEIGGTELNERLVGLLRDVRVNVNVRSAIARALGSLGEKSVVTDLLGLLRDEQVNVDVRYSITEALGALGEKAVASDLLSLLRDERVNRNVRYFIARALGTLGEKALAGDLLGLLRDRRVERGIRSAIATALGTLGEKGVVGDLLGLLHDERVERNVRGAIAAALGILGEKGAVSDLLSLLRNRRVERNVRGAIATALGTLGEKGVVSDLLSLLHDERVERDVYVRGAIAAALGTLGEKEVVSDLLSLLCDWQVEREIRSAIAAALGTLGEKGVVSELLGLLHNKQVERGVGSAIAAALGTLGEKGVVGDLLGLLHNEQVDWGVQRAIAAALGKLVDDIATVQELAVLLQTSRVVDSIHRALWEISRRMRITIYITDGQMGPEVKIVPWE